MALDLKVIERGSSVASAYCGRLLGMLGADVVKVEPPGGDRMRDSHPRATDVDGVERSTLFEYLNCFKRSVVVDAAAPAGAEEIANLMAGADVVIDHVDGDVERALADAEAARARNPRLVYLALSGFGLTGPYKSYKSNEFIDFATGGYTGITGSPDREPLQGGGPWGGYAHGLTGAIGVLAAVRTAQTTGQGQLVDVGAMEAIATLHQWSMTLYTHQGVVKRRAGNMHAESYNPMGPVECGDGWVSVGVASAQQWEGFTLAIDRPELLADDRFQTGGDRVDHAEALAEIIGPALMALTASELTSQLQEFHVPASPVLTVAEVLEEAQLHAREFWVRSDRFGDTARMPERAFRVPGLDAPFTPAPEAGADTATVLAEAADTTNKGAAR
jgi:crotonobetainyl-CoA:carnitine CoA-transferase CaiB-like acyl-CoA transferase